MTVETTSTFAGPYTLNGVATAFPFSFKALSADEVRVEIGGAIVDPAQFTVQISSQGGTAIFSTPPIGGDLYVISDPDFRQGISFSNQAAFLPASHNEANDRAAVRDQVLAEGLVRAIQLPLGEEAPVLPPAAERAGGNKIVAPDPITGAITVLDGSAFTGNTGPANNTYTSYTALQASDPTRKYAYLAGDTDVPSRPDGPYSNTTGNVGEWQPQSAAGVSVTLPRGTATVQDAATIGTDADIRAYMKPGDTSMHQAFTRAYDAGIRSLFIPAGDYTSSVPMNCGDGMNVRGGGPDNTHITYTGINEGGCFRIDTGRGTTISDLHIHVANDAYYGGVYIINSGLVQDTLVRRVRVTMASNVYRDTMTFVAANAGSNIDGVTIEDCVLDGYGQMGIECLNQGALGDPNRPYFRRLVIRGSTFKNPRTIISNFAPGISIDGLIDKPEVCGNVFYGCPGSANEVIETFGAYYHHNRYVNCVGALVVSSNSRPVYDLKISDESCGADPGDRSIFTGSAPGAIVANCKLNLGAGNVNIGSGSTLARPAQVTNNELISTGHAIFAYSPISVSGGRIDVSGGNGAGVLLIGPPAKGSSVLSARFHKSGGTPAVFLVDGLTPGDIAAGNNAVVAPDGSITVGAGS